MYRCSVVPEAGTGFTDCLRFTGPGLISGKFEFVSDQLGTAIGCTCEPLGNPARPKFNRSNVFSCTAAEGVSFAGSVSKNGKVAKGSAANLHGGSYAFACKVDSACSTAP